MNCKQNRIAVLLLMLALLLALLTGCGGGNQETPPAAPPSSEAAQPVPPEDAGEPQSKAEEPSEEPPEVSGPDTKPEEAPVADAPVEPAPPSKPEETPLKVSEPAPKPQAAPSPEPAPELEGESVRAGDTYTISVALEGGSGRATVESPARLRYDETGKCWATIVWSSPNFDYMKVDGQRYDPINTEGNSTFEILVSVFDQPLTVIADTVAMSEPHEVEYTLTFDYASMEDA